MRRGLLAVSFGSSYPTAVERAIVPTEEDLGKAFPEFTIYRAFTSPRIRAKILKRDGIQMPSPEEAWEKMAADGIEEVLVQPLQVVPGEEYAKVAHLTVKMKNSDKFKRIEIGRTLLHYNGQEDRPDDYHEVAEILASELPTPGLHEGIILMGHGSPSHPNVAYELMGIRFQRRWPWIHLATVEGGPGLADLFPALKAAGYRTIHLVPFMWVAGDHALNDMAGEEESWKTELEAQGYKVICHLNGMGEYPKMREIFFRRAQDAWSDK